MSIDVLGQRTFWGGDDVITKRRDTPAFLFFRHQPMNVFRRLSLGTCVHMRVSSATLWVGSLCRTDADSHFFLSTCSEEVLLRDNMHKQAGQHVPHRVRYVCPKTGYIF